MSIGLPNLCFSLVCLCFLFPFSFFHPSSSLSQNPTLFLQSQRSLKDSTVVFFLSFLFIFLKYNGCLSFPSFSSTPIPSVSVPLPFTSLQPHPYIVFTTAKPNNQVLSLLSLPVSRFLGLSKF